MASPFFDFRTMFPRAADCPLHTPVCQVPLPENEAERLKALRSYDLTGSEPDPDLYELVQLAGHQCETPIALISLLESDHQWFLARTGLKAPETSRDVAFCAYTIMSDQIMVVEDALHDDRFRNNAMVTGDPNIRFYAGMPLITGEGFAIGTLCVIDRKPRTLTASQAIALRVLARQLVNSIELRKKVRQYQQAQQSLRAIASMQSHQVRSSLSSILGLLQLVNPEGLSEENQEYFTLLNTTARKLDQTISTIVYTTGDDMLQKKF